jgi:rod shape determining protein RodA
MLAPDASARQRLLHLNWWVVLTIVALGCYGLLMLYSAAGGSWQPWALTQGVRFSVLLLMMLALALVPLPTWLQLAYPIYGLVLLLLVVVEVSGVIVKGSQRWIDLGIIRLQPSELMKVALVLALARYYNDLPRVSVTSWTALWPPLVLIGLPALLAILQPDLGSGLLLAMGGITMLFLAGVQWWLFAGGIGAGLLAMPVVWSLLHDYQRERVMTFLDPSSDPLGAGYHITQSKIAIGSGGLTGKGLLEGTQGHLRFLPERQTDFIFAMMAEELGLVGGALMVLLYGVIFGWMIWIAATSRSLFGRLVAMGLAMTLFFYVAINTLMVMGILPVVGEPLPLVSYGGSSMMTMLIALGIVFSASLHRDEQVHRPEGF